MQTVIRADSSAVIGSGHLMRSLTLAERLRKDKNAEVRFISRDLPGNLSFLVTQKGFKLHLLPPAKENKYLSGYAKWLTVTEEQDAEETLAILNGIGKVDLLVVDHYALDIVWENHLHPLAEKIFVIDDLANRKHNCDILLDQNFYLDKDKRYVGLVPENSELRLGPKYALLRKEFFEVRKRLKKRDGKIQRLLIFYGGSDATNETEKAIRAILRLNACVDTDIVVGARNPHKESIKTLCNSYEFLHYYEQVDNMAELMNNADLMLGAGGATTWERCFLGLPCIVTAIAENQERVCEDCYKVGFIDYAGKISMVSEDIIRAKLEQYLRFGIDFRKWNFDIDW